MLCYVMLACMGWRMVRVDVVEINGCGRAWIGGFAHHNANRNGGTENLNKTGQITYNQFTLGEVTFFESDWSEH